VVMLLWKYASLSTELQITG